MSDDPSGHPRIGFLGGTFDPPHVGHLLLAETARDRLGLDRVLFVPAGEPPHKQNQPITAPEHRLTMTRLAVAGNPHFVVDESDLTRPGPHYTASLVPLLQEKYPDAQLWLLIGGDSLRDFPTWHEPGAIIARCRLAVLPRPGAAFDWPPLEEAVPGIRDATDVLAGPSVAVSGTEIRRWVPAGRSIRYLTPPVVRNYLAATTLYQTES